MKKAEFSTDKSVSILLILVFLVVIVLAISPIKDKLFAATTSIFSDDKTYEGSEQKNKMIEEFKLFNEKVKSCQDSNNKDCFCNINLNFPDDHELFFDSKEAKLVRNKNAISIQNLILNKVLTSNLNCNVESVDNRFDEKRIVRTLLSDLKFFDDKYDLLKTNKGDICWVTNSINLDVIKDKKVC